MYHTQNFIVAHAHVFIYIICLADSHIILIMIKIDNVGGSMFVLHGCQVIGRNTRKHLQFSFSTSATCFYCTVISVD